MLESSISDKIVFKSRESYIKFVSDIKIKSTKSNKELAKEIGVCTRTLSDWSRGKYNMPYRLAKDISKKYKVSFPRDFTWLPWKLHTSKAGLKGGAINWKINKKIGGDVEKRKEKWRNWWNKSGKNSRGEYFVARDILIPKQNEKLAEFIGIVLGDGGISDYQVCINLNKNEISYRKFILKLTKELFDIDAKIYFRKESNGVDIVMQRKKLVQFILGHGLAIGDKIRGNSDIPNWIMKRSGFQRACIRGLIDTDGCIFVHKYKSAGKIYRYVKIDFTSHSRNILFSAYKILINLGFNVRICRAEKALRIESQEDVKKYLKTVGTHNPRYVT